MILKQLLFGTLVCATLGFASCGSDTEGTSTEQSDSTSNTTDTSMMPSAQISDTTAMPAGAPVAEGMNPAHGEPGHRCDIAVGAPLSTPKAEPGAAASQPIQIQQTPQGTVTPQPAAGGSGKVNPPHGQPGHDCKVAVGAPLP